MNAPNSQTSPSAAGPGSIDLSRQANERPLGGGAKGGQHLPAAGEQSSLAVSLAIFAVSVSLTAYFRLWLFRDHSITVTYGLPLLLCAWHRDLRLLWAMAVTFIGMSALKAFWILPEPGLAGFPNPTPWLMQVVNILAIGGTVHAMLRLMGRRRVQNMHLAETRAARDKLWDGVNLKPLLREV